MGGKAGKAFARPKFSGALTLSQSGMADFTQPLALPYLKFFVIMPLYTNSPANVPDPYFPSLILRESLFTNHAICIFCSSIRKELSGFDLQHNNVENCD